MMIIIKILVVIVALVSVIAVIAMFTKKSYTLRRDIVINKSQSEVFDFLKYNRNQPSFSVWLQADPQTNITYNNVPDGTTGAMLSFQSKSHKTGTGEWEIKNVHEADLIEFQLRFIEPFAFVADGSLHISAIDATHSKVEWVYNSGMNWPMNIMLSVMDMDKVVGPDMLKSLENCKGILEGK